MPIEGATQYVQIGCSIPLFWNASGCGYAPVQEMPTLYQPFERGFMLRAGDALYSVIFNDAHEATIYAELERVELGTPPEGLVAPDAAFVDVWTSTPLYQEKLGWATGPAESYTAQVQTAHYHIRDTTQQHGVTLPDGRIILLSGSAFGGPAFDGIGPSSGQSANAGTRRAGVPFRCTIIYPIAAACPAGRAAALHLR